MSSLFFGLEETQCVLHPIRHHNGQRHRLFRMPSLRPLPNLQKQPRLQRPRHNCDPSPQKLRLTLRKTGISLALRPLDLKTIKTAVLLKSTRELVLRLQGVPSAEGVIIRGVQVDQKVILYLTLITVIIQMAWYDKNKVPEWRIFVERGYSCEGMVGNKDMIMLELPKVEELQQFVKRNRDAIVSDFLQLCLEYPLEGSSYDRKYSLPTKAIELLTCELFFACLGWDKQSIRRYVGLLFKCFSTVDPHFQNVNLYHAYFQRLFRVLFMCRVVDKLDLISALQEQQAKNKVLDHLFKHAYKLSIGSCLQIMMSVDFIETFVTISPALKKSIIDFVFNTLEGYLKKGVEVEKTDNCLQILKTFLEKTINYLALIYRIDPQSPLNGKKMELFFEIYAMFRYKFPVLIGILTKTADSSIKVLVLEVLQLNQILLSQPELRTKMPIEEYLKLCEELIVHTFANRVNLATPFFVDWLIITFSEIGRHDYQIQTFCRLNILQNCIKLMLNNRSNNILNAKIYQLLKIIFQNIADIQVITSIEKHKSVNINLISFRLLNNYLDNLRTIQSAIRQFKTINDPLFVTVFNLYKIISQYCRNIDSIFNLYIHLEICKQTKPALARVIEFQRQQPCFSVYEREIAKDLGKFYSDEMFANHLPLEFTVRPLAVPLAVKEQPLHISMPVMDTQTIIQMPTTTIATPIITVQFQAKEEEQPIKLVFQTKSQPILPQPPEFVQKQLSSSEPIQQQNQEDNPNKYGNYMRHQLKQVQANLQLRRSKSRTPTKIKNQLKKAKNKWVNSQEQPLRQIKNAFSCEVKEKNPRSVTSPKLIKALQQFMLEKISLIKVPNSRLPKLKKEREITLQRDGRLLAWLKALRA